MSKSLTFCLLLIIALIWSATVSAKDPQPERHRFAYGDTVRTYAIHLPEGLKPGAPLVVYTHGYGSSMRWLKDLNEVAYKNGFAVCYPDGSPASR